MPDVRNAVHRMGNDSLTALHSAFKDARDEGKTLNEADLEIEQCVKDEIAERVGGDGPVDLKAMFLI